MSSFDSIGIGDAFRPRLLHDGKVVPEREDEADGFGAILEDTIGGVARLKSEVKEKAEAMARGEPVPLHELMISMGKSEVAFNLMLEIRNKLLDAWQTLSRST